MDLIYILSLTALRTIKIKKFLSARKILFYGHVFTIMLAMNLEQKVAKALMHHHKDLAVAESCSGGLLSHRLTNIPGSSKFLKFTLVAYSYAAKTKLLKVPPTILKKFGAVSRQVASVMALNAQKIFNTDFSVAITGIAGPTGATKFKPIGLTYISVATKNDVWTFEFIFKGTRLQIKNAAATQALRLLYREIRG